MTPIPYPADPNSTVSYLSAFIELVKILRAECPWDREQTHESISHLLIEEAYETLDAIAAADDNELSKELGDLLLHVVMHAVMAEQRGAFSLRDVVHNEFTKLVHRHPHIFSNVEANDPQTVLETWERTKMKEGRTSVLGGVPRTLPAALRAQRVQEKAANVGFDWHDKADVWAKVDEELAELKVEIEAQNAERTASEFGDVFFALINAARHENVIAEDALHGTIAKFITRFQYIEQQTNSQGKVLSEMSLSEMDAFWNDAKEKGL